MRARPLFLEIPNPCNEDWDKMEPTANGKFCDHCQHNVIDFSNWSDEAIFKFMSKPNAPHCGMFADDKLDRAIYPPFVHRNRFYRAAAVLGFTILTSQSGPANARHRAPFSFNALLADIDSKLDEQTDSLHEISGCVIDNHKQPLGQANVLLTQNGQTLCNVETDMGGNFSFNNIKNGDYTLTVSKTGLARQVVNISVNQTNIVSLQFTLSPPVAHGKPEYHQPIKKGVIRTKYFPHPPIKTQEPDTKGQK